MAKEIDSVGRNKRWQKWYPSVVPNFAEIPVGDSPYGKPNGETLEIFSKLAPGAKVGDIGGGEGRYALPLAQMGHRVLVTDVDLPHLRRAKEKNKLVKGEGIIVPLQTDATDPRFPIQDESLDSVLNAGFGYLIPPEELDPLVGKMARALREEGILVFEFATNRDRRDTKGDSLLSPEEYNYSSEEGLHVLGDLTQKHGIGSLEIHTKTIHLEEPYYLHTDLLIAHGVKH